MAPHPSLREEEQQSQHCRHSQEGGHLATNSRSMGLIVDWIAVGHWPTIVGNKSCTHWIQQNRAKYANHSQPFSNLVDEIDINRPGIAEFLVEYGLVRSR